MIGESTGTRFVQRFLNVLPSSEQQALQALAARRRQLVAMCVVENQRLSVCHAADRKSIAVLIKAIHAQLDAIETELDEHIQTHHADLAQWLSSARDVSPATLTALIADVPKLGDLISKSSSKSFTGL
jgi:transposase